MKKFLTHIAVFSLIFLFILALPVLFVSSYDNSDKTYNPNSNVVVLQTKSEFDNLDILFVGNSYCFSGIIPTRLEQAGYNSYNLSIATAGVQFYRLMITDYLKHTEKNPKMVFLLISPTTFSNNADNYSSYPAHRYLESPLSNLDIAIQYNNRSKLISMYRKSFKKGLTNLFTEPDTHVPLYSKENRGYVFSDQILTDSLQHANEHLYDPLKIEKELPMNRIQELKNIAIELQGQGVTVAFFELPTNTLHGYFDSMYMKEYKSLVTVLSKSYPLFSISDSLVDQSHFRNIDHMNHKGAEVATNEMINYLEDASFFDQ